jgi:DNA-binding SARP family transcriptional activator
VVDRAKRRWYVRLGAMPEMDFRLLGPLEVLEDGRPLAVGGVQSRALLAVLLLHANHVVSRDRLVDELWGEAPPPTAGKIVQVYVSRLRKRLGEARVLTRPPGYVLRAEPAELDLARFERLVADARRAEAGTAAEMLRNALALWRGPPLADLAFERFAQAEIVRLEELRWAALELRIDADLAAGRAAELIGELEALIAEHPLRERLHAQLMLALYRCARQAEALAAYRRARGELADGLGLELGEELRRLEQAILRQDPALDGPPRGEAPPPGRAVLVAPRTLSGAGALLALAEPLAASHELVVACVVAPADLAGASRELAQRRDELLARGLPVRAAAFSSPTPDGDVVRLAAQERVDLLLTDADPAVVAGLLEHAPCDVALLVAAGGAPRPGPLLVPFGGGWHDWAALELGAWLAQATGAPLQVVGASASGRGDGRDASRLLADASLILQRTAAIVAEPVLAEPGRSGVRAAAAGAGLLVVGLSDRWRQEGLGRLRAALAHDPPAPTVIVRRGPRPGGLAPREPATRFGWSLTGGAA